MRYPLAIIGLILLALMTWARFDPASLPAGWFRTNEPDVLEALMALWALFTALMYVLEASDDPTSSWFVNTKGGSVKR